MGSSCPNNLPHGNSGCKHVLDGRKLRVHGDQLLPLPAHRCFPLLRVFVHFFVLLPNSQQLLLQGLLVRLRFTEVSPCRPGHCLRLSVAGVRLRVRFSGNNACAAYGRLQGRPGPSAAGWHRSGRRSGRRGASDRRQGAATSGPVTLGGRKGRPGASLGTWGQRGGSVTRT